MWAVLHSLGLPGVTGLKKGIGDPVGFFPRNTLHEGEQESWPGSVMTRSRRLAGCMTRLSPEDDARRLVHDGKGKNAYYHRSSPKGEYTP